MSIEQAAPGSCVVWGGYGYGNTGDDLVLAVAVAGLRQQHGDKLVVLSPTPEQTRLALPDTPVVLQPSGHPQNSRVKALCRWAEFADSRGAHALADRLYRAVLRHSQRFTEDSAWLQTLASASRLHLAGGGYLTDRFHLRHLVRPLRLAKSRGVRITTSPLGLGPFLKAAKAEAVAELLRTARVVVRDADSLRFCTAHGLAAVEQPDDGFHWRQVIDLPDQSTATATKTIGVCIYPQHSSHWSPAVESWWVTALHSLARTFPGWRFEGFCFHTGREMDYATARRLFERAGWNAEWVLPPEPDFRVAIRNLARYRAVVSCRFHAVVTATVLKLPCVAVVLDDYYESKMRGALKYAPAPLTLINPLRDAPSATSQWLASQGQT